MHPKRAKELDELRSIYQPVASAINLWKNQQWKMVHYGLLLLAAIVGIFELFNRSELDFPPWIRYILPFLTIPATALPTYYIHRNEQLLQRDRERLTKIKRDFEPNVQHLLATPESYTTPKYDRGYYIPFITVLWISWFLAFVYLVREAGMVDFLKLILQILIGSSIGSFIGSFAALRIARIGHWRPERRENNEE